MGHGHAGEHMAHPPTNLDGLFLLRQRFTLGNQLSPILGKHSVHFFSPCGDIIMESAQVPCLCVDMPARA